MMIVDSAIVRPSVQPHAEPTPPPRTLRKEFFIGDTVGFTDKHLSERELS
jgi:hypothetical protein